MCVNQKHLIFFVTACITMLFLSKRHRQVKAISMKLRIITFINKLREDQKKLSPVSKA